MLKGAAREASAEWRPARPTLGGGSSNGKAQDSDSCYLGSNPSPPANNFHPSKVFRGPRPGWWPDTAVAQATTEAIVAQMARFHLLARRVTMEFSANSIIISHGSDPREPMPRVAVSRTPHSGVFLCLGRPGEQRDQ